MDATSTAAGPDRDDRCVMLTGERIEAATAAGHWPDRTAADYLDDALRHYPDKVFVTDYKSEAGTRTTLSYRDIDRISRRIGAGLAAHGIGKGDVVAFQLPNWWEFAAIHLACVRIGAVSNPLMPIFRARELEFMLSFAETRAIFVPRRFRGFEYEPMLDGLRGKLPDLEHVFVLEGGRNGAGSAGGNAERKRVRGRISRGALGRRDRHPKPSSTSGASIRTRSSRSATPRAPPGSRRG